MKEKGVFLDSRELYTVYNVGIKMRRKLCGGMPKNPEVLRTWIATKTGFDDEKTTEQEKKAREALLEPTVEKSWVGFPSSAKGPYIDTRQVKALFKECASLLRITLQKRGSKQILQHGFEVKGLDEEDKVYFKSASEIKTYETPIHVSTPAGPRSALKRVDYVENAVLEFEVWVLQTESSETRHIGEKEMRQMLTLGQENGLGADRSQGNGKFDVFRFERARQ